MEVLAFVGINFVDKKSLSSFSFSGGAQGEPLYLDVCTSLMQQGRGHLLVAGGRYGLGSKDFTPRMVMAVIQNMLRKNMHDIQRPFTVGITDDVTNLSLPLGRHVNVFDESVTQCKYSSASMVSF